MTILIVIGDIRKHLPATALDDNIQVIIAKPFRQLTMEDIITLMTLKFQSTKATFHTTPPEPEANEMDVDSEELCHASHQQMYTPFPINRYAQSLNGRQSSGSVRRWNGMELFLPFSLHHNPPDLIKAQSILACGRVVAIKNPPLDGRQCRWTEKSLMSFASRNHDGPSIQWQSSLLDHECYEQEGIEYLLDWLAHVFNATSLIGYHSSKRLPKQSGQPGNTAALNAYDTFGPRVIMMQVDFAPMSSVTQMSSKLMDIAIHKNVLLTPGVTLIQPPGVLHQVFTVENCICTGGHFYTANTMHLTEFAHSHVAAIKLQNTNASHLSTVRILARMTIQMAAGPLNTLLQKPFISLTRMLLWADNYMAGDTYPEVAHMLSSASLTQIQMPWKFLPYNMSFKNNLPHKVECWLKSKVCHSSKLVPNKDQNILSSKDQKIEMRIRSIQGAVYILLEAAYGLEFKAEQHRQEFHTEEKKYYKVVPLERTLLMTMDQSLREG
ncbi:hypothetical protein BDW22DRAFT_1345367 [Trametopsis cervina]|nr:hypothetical protein BDW22DRAFT_1345367 [Trametopsis cervina]